MVKPHDPAVIHLVAACDRQTDRQLGHTHSYYALSIPRSKNMTYLNLTQ